MKFGLEGGSGNKLSNFIKVGIILPSCLSYGGGGEKFVHNLSIYLSKNSYTVSIFEDIDMCFKQSSQKELKELNIDLKMVSYKYYSLIKLGIISQRLPPTLYLLSYSLILIMCYRLPSRKFALEINTKKINAVFLFHGITFEKFSPFNLKAWLYSIMNKCILKINAGTYIKCNLKFQVLNPNCDFILKKYGVKEKNIFLSDLSLDSDKFKPVRNEKEFIVVYISRLEDRQKGINRLIRIVKELDKLKLSDLKILIAGRGSAMHKITKIANNTNIIKYLGYINEQTKTEILSTGGVFISTSNIEPYGLSVIEGLYSGLPAVVTPVSGLVHIVSRDKKYGKVSSFSPKPFVYDILKFYNMWKLNKENYFNKRIYISVKSKQTFSKYTMFESMSEMIRGSKC